MSSWFKIEMTVSGYNAARQKDIVSAANEHWNFGAVDYRPATAYEVVSMLFAGEDKASGEPDDTVMTIVEAVWKANGSYCVVDIQSLCLEDLPYNQYCTGKEEYTDMIPEEK